MKFKILYLKILLLAFYFASLPKMTVVKALENSVLTKHQVVYDIQENLNTVVTHSVEISFNDTKKGLQTITFTEPVDFIKNISTEDNIDYQIEAVGNIVQVSFNTLMVGPKSQTIVYSYNTNQIFKQTGTTYTLEIPKLEEHNSIENFELKVYLPNKLTTQNSKYPINTDNKGTFILLTKDNLLKGEPIIFGNEMYYLISISYIINKDKDYIIIPPLIDERQDVFVKSLSESPKKVYIDSNKNTVYKFDKIDETVINAEILVKVYGDKSEQKNINTKVLTKATKNWDYTKGIPTSFLKYESPNINYQSVKDSVDFVTTYLEYDKSKTNYDYIARVGAENINETNKNNAVCLEYSDLLIALLRGQGISARELNGLAYVEDINNPTSPLLHSWVDYNIEGTWKQIDPTYIDTSNQNYLDNFDLNHIILLIRQENSEHPLLGGSYRTDKNAEKLTVKALNTNPEKEVLKIKVLSLGPVTIVKNVSNNIFKKTYPKAFSIYLTNNFNRDLSNGFLYAVHQTPLGLKDIFAIDPLVIVIIVAVLISPFFFYLIHKNLSTKKEKVKSKVRSIS